MSSLKRGRDEEGKTPSFTASGFPADKKAPWLKSVPSADKVLESLTLTQYKTMSNQSSAASVRVCNDKGTTIYETPITNPTMLNGALEISSEQKALGILGESFDEKVAAVPKGGFIILTISSFPWGFIIINIIILLAKALKADGKRIIIVSARESDSHQESLIWLEGVNGLDNIDFVNVYPTTDGGHVAVYTVKKGVIHLGTLSRARNPQTIGNATDAMIVKAEIDAHLPTGSLMHLQRMFLSGTASNCCREDVNVVARLLKNLFNLNPALRTLQTDGFTLEMIEQMQKKCTKRGDVQPNPATGTTSENYILNLYNKNVTASKL